MKDRLKKIFTEKRVALLIRWWSVGAVYFFIGWGTNLGQTSIIDFVFFLGLSIGVFNMLIVNPIIKHMFNITPKVRYSDIPVYKKVLGRLAEIFKSMFIVFIMTYVYNILNTVLIGIMGLSEESIPLAGEPVSFGIIYILLWVLLESFIKNIKKRVEEKDTKVETL